MAASLVAGAGDARERRTREEAPDLAVRGGGGTGFGRGGEGHRRRRTIERDNGEHTGLGEARRWVKKK